MCHKYYVKHISKQFNLDQVQSMMLVEVRRGAGTCDLPCILGRVLDSAFIQARVRLNYSDSLIYTGCHGSTPHLHEQLPKAVTEL